jgi:hypothetical protein
MGTLVLLHDALQSYLFFALEKARGGLSSQKKHLSKTLIPLLSHGNKGIRENKNDAVLLLRVKRNK